MKLNEVKFEYKSKQYLAESWDVLTEAQQVYVGSWEKKVWPLVENYSKLFEAELTPDQINGLFSKAETVASQSGTNQTVLGKAGKISGSIASKLKTEIEKLAKQAQDSAPIQNIDNAFDGLRTQISQTIGKGSGGQAVLGIVDKWKDYVKENPAKGAFVIAAMTSSLAFASGGIVSGMAIGFFLKLANNILTGDKLSSAVAKTGKQMAIGALAGGLGKIAADAAADLFPAEVTDIFTSADGSTIDLSQVEAMNMTAEQLTPDAVQELLQTRNAFLGLAKDLASDSPEAGDAIGEQIKEINDKIFELSPEGATANEAANNLANEYGIKGDGVNLEKTTSTSTQDGDGDVTVEPAGSIDADKIQAAGLDYMTQPELSDEFKEFLAEKGIDEDQIQAQAGFDRAVGNETWLGVKVGGSEQLQAFDGKMPEGFDTNAVAQQIDIPDGLQGGQTFSSEVSTSFDGLEGQDLRFTADYSFEGVDADGNDVYTIKSVFTAPESKITDGMLESLSESDQEKFWELYGKYTGENIDTSEAGVTQYIDDLNQKLANGFVGAIATVALAGAVADAENKQAKAQAQESYIKNVENQLLEQYLEEGPALDLMKKAAMATVKGVGTVADKAVGGVTAAGMKAAQTAIKTGKSVGHELGNKITLKKLQSAWAKAGKPTNIAGVVQVMQTAGMDDEQIGILNKEVKDIDLTTKDQPNKEPESGSDASAPEASTSYIDIEKLANIIKSQDLDDEVRAILAKSAKAA